MYRAPDYWSNMDLIEELWKKVRDGNFANRKDKDELFGACTEGRQFFWTTEIANCKKQGWDLPPKVPAYERAIMLLEHEEKWKTALALAENALKVGIKNKWYDNRIKKLKKKIEETST